MPGLWLTSGLCYRQRLKDHLIFISSSCVSIEIFGRVALAGDGLSYYFKVQRARERRTDPFTEHCVFVAINIHGFLKSTATADFI